MELVNYLTRTGAVIPIATSMTPANLTAPLPTQAPLTPVIDGATAGSRPEIGLLTVRPDFVKGTLRQNFLQTFGLTQGQQAVTCANSNIVTIHCYIIPDPMTLIKETFA